jgi:hypothetical protein
MPLFRYRACTGSVLLALLFLSDWYFPKFLAEPARADVDRSIIRIHSRHRWPDALVFDTNQPTINPPAVETADIPVKKSPRDALALAAPLPAAVAAKPVSEARPVIRKRPTKTVHLTARQADGFPPAFTSGW